MTSAGILYAEARRLRDFAQTFDEGTEVWTESRR